MFCLYKSLCMWSHLKCIRKWSKRTETREKMESWRRKMKPRSRSWWRGERTAADRWSIRGAGRRKKENWNGVMRERKWRGKGRVCLIWCNNICWCSAFTGVKSRSIIKSTASRTCTHTCVRVFNIRYWPVMLSCYPEKNFINKCLCREFWCCMM